MAGLIPQSFIDELLTRSDIIEVIDSRVPLKKAGREYTACCPFHNEKTPSFTVSPGKQFYHCFGCGAHGSAIGFLMEYEHLNFPEAVEELARINGLEVPRESGPAPDPKAKQRQTTLYDLMGQCDRFYRQQLRQHPASKRAKNYLKEQRGLTGEIATVFGIGYAPPGWDTLNKALNPDNKPELEQQLVDLGMLIRKDEGGSYDRFRDRILFPIRDQRGRTIAFGGRILGDEKPKYLNSPETPLFHKGRELYGLFEMRQAMRHIDRILVVEGYMDVVALAQYHIRYAVATLGTATTPDHLNKLFRICPEVVFCFDGDRAGREAAWRALENALPILKEGHEIRFLFLPDGEDPDTLVRKEGKVDFEKRMSEATPLSEYFYSQLRQELDISSPEGRSRFVELARPSLEKLPNGLFRTLMVEQLAQLTNLHPSQLALSATKVSSKITAPEKVTSFKPAANTEITPSLVAKGVKIIVHRPDLCNLLKDKENFEKTQLPGINIFSEIATLAKDNPGITTASLLSRLENRNYGPRLKRLLSKEQLLDGEPLEEEFKATLEILRKRVKQLRRDELYDRNFYDLTTDEKNELKVLATDKSLY
ncbi:MAG: DNA primase [Gammaproteobacteria bacterium]|nr:DNA primase [Gammaproteobacteria bacterium]MDH5653940.1 DNA primase [Gammaproteobacteria bacterium]